MAEYGEMYSVKGEELETALWLPQESPKGIIQIVHGMCEHIRRYEDTAKALNREGFIVVGHSHLGHNRNSRQLGYFSHEGGWDALVEDVHTLRQSVQSKYPKLPYFLLGHSMGSFVVRTYCLKYEEGLSGVILSGTGYYPKAVVGFARGVARLQCSLGMEKKPGKLLNMLSSSGNNKRYEDVQSEFDWLSRDRVKVRQYIDDPYCGFLFSVGAYRDMFDGLSRLYPEKLKPLKKDIPVLFFSGDMDPIGSYGQGVRQVADEWKQQGVKDITVKLYPGARHEMFNEINREEVWNDLLDWVKQRI